MVESWRIRSGEWIYKTIYSMLKANMISPEINAKVKGFGKME
jgi:hypothetical protein